MCAIVAALSRDTGQGEGQLDAPQHEVPGRSGRTGSKSSQEGEACTGQKGNRGQVALVNMNAATET